MTSQNGLGIPSTWDFWSTWKSRWSLLQAHSGLHDRVCRLHDFYRRCQRHPLAPLAANYSHLSEAERMVVFGGLTTYNVTGVFMAMLLIGVIIGLMVASPFFILPRSLFGSGLNGAGKEDFIPGSFSVLFLFLLGRAFGYYILLPRTITAVIWFNQY